MTDPAVVDRLFVDRLFTVTGDAQEQNLAYELMIRELLKAFRESLWRAVKRLTEHYNGMYGAGKGTGVEKAGEEVAEVGKGVVFRLQESREFRRLRSDANQLASALYASNHDFAPACRAFLLSLPDTLLLKATCRGGEGVTEWCGGVVGLDEWGQQLREVMRTLEVMPCTAQRILRDLTSPVLQTVAIPRNIGVPGDCMLGIVE